MITITLQLTKAEHIDAAIALLQRIRDDEAASEAKFQALFGAAKLTDLSVEVVSTEREPGTDEEEQPEPVVVAQPVKRTRRSPPAEQPAADPPAPVEPPAPPPAPAPAVTLVEVRALLATLSRDGRADAVKALLAEFGAAKLTDLAAEHYPAVMARAGEL